MSSSFVKIIQTTFFMVAFAMSQVSIGAPIDSAPIDHFLTEQFKTSKIIFLGENHSTDLHRTHLVSTLTRLIENKVIDTFATEAILASRQGILDQYLQDKSAAPKSEIEYRYFDRLGEGLNWFKDPTIRSLFRRLRELNLTQPESIRICGVDVNTEPHGSPERAKEIAQRIDFLSQRTKSQLELVSGLPLRAIIESQDWWDREILMAKALAKCATGRRAVLTQVGAMHGWSTRNSFEKNQKWWAMSTWLKWLTGENKILTLSHGTTSIRQSDHPFLQPYIRATELLALDQYGIYPSSSLLAELKPIFYLEGMDTETMVDYWIFGPWGSEIVHSDRD